MSSTHSQIRPHTHLFLRLPNDSLKLLEIKPNTIIDVGKLGSFPSNLLLSRPYHYTYEILDKQPNESYSRLRIVTPSELNADIVAEDVTPSESRGDPATPIAANGEGYDLVREDGTVVMKNNRLTIDDASRQALSHQEIEELKKSAGGKEIIEKILANHAGLDEKTTFSKAKYTLRKTKKYLKRFTALPMDFGGLIDYVTCKESPRIMELREETLGLIMAWSSAHFSGVGTVELEDAARTRGRWLVVDDTGGLVVAALAERMGILYPADDASNKPTSNGTRTASSENDSTSKQMDTTEPQIPSTEAQAKLILHTDHPTPAKNNTITLLHPAVQPNVSILKYFSYDTNQPSPTHPLHTHFKALSWLQLLHPEKDATYTEPEVATEHTLRGWKSGKRSTYWKKRRRWERCKAVVDDTRIGDFDGLVIASNMDPVSILPHAVPLIRGGGHVVIFSPTSEPLVRVMDLYSRDRRAAYLNQLAQGNPIDIEDFPVDPRLLLAPTLQTSRVREWQVLPGRTHPRMTSRGGPEGYVFTARRVLPLGGGVEARGNFYSKKRKVGEEGAAVPS